jgi:hypothetical protein
MHEVKTGTSITSTVEDDCRQPYDLGDQALEQQVQNALNLFLTLKNPAQRPALLSILDAVKPQIQAALGALHYVHFARYFPGKVGNGLSADK